LLMEPFLVLPPTEKFKDNIDPPNPNARQNVPKPGIIIEEIRTYKQQTNEISFPPEGGYSPSVRDHSPNHNDAAYPESSQ
jgi:hypothetical protein